MDIASILIKLNSPILFDEFSMKAMGSLVKIEMDLGGIKVLGAWRSWVDGPDSGYGIGFDASNQTIQEVVELEDLVGSSRDIRPLG
jgi:hypothetical protein